MVNTNCLRDEIRVRGVSKSSLCEKMGINMQSLNNKLSGRTSFRAEEIYSLSKALFLSDEELLRIFFADNVDRCVNIKDETCRTDC